MPGARVRPRAVALGVVVAPSVTIFGLVVGALLLGAPVLAQSDGPLLLRQPTLSRTQIAFSYAGDIWVVPREGGEARRLTTGLGDASNPVFSPDGSTIAYSATVDGNHDVYVMPASGGVARRLTYHPASDTVVGWTPDGRKVLFESPRNIYVGYRSFRRLYAVSAQPGGFPDELPLPIASEGVLSRTTRVDCTAWHR